MPTLNDTRGNKRLYRWEIGGLFLGLLLLLFCSRVYAAESGLEVLKFLQRYEIDHTSSLLDDAFRRIGFAILKWLGSLSDSLYSSIGTIYRFLSFGYSQEITSLAQRYSVLYKVLFLVSLTFFGLYLICGSKTQGLNTVSCLMLMALVVTSMPLLTSKMSELTIHSADYVKNQWVQESRDAEVTSVAGSVLSANLVDLQKVDRNLSGTSVPGITPHKGYHDLKAGSKEWRYLDINAVMDYDKELKHDFWNQKLVQQEDGSYDTETMEAWLDLGNCYYYRYQILSWFQVLAVLASVVLVLFFVCIKCGKLVIDVAMASIYLPFVAVTDLASGQRIREALKHFLVLFAVLFLCVALVGVYFAGIAFINAKVTGTMPNLVMHLALAWAVLDGPGIIERIAGVDAGMKSVWQKLMGARAAVSLGSSAAKTAAAAGRGVRKAAGAAARAAVGTDRAKAAKEKLSAQARQTVRQATDGKGLLGLGGQAARKTAEAAETVQDRIVPEHSREGTARQAAKAEAGIRGTVGSSPLRPPGQTASQAGPLGARSAAAKAHAPQDGTGAEPGARRYQAQVRQPPRGIARQEIRTALQEEERLRRQTASGQKIQQAEPAGISSMDRVPHRQGPSQDASMQQEARSQRKPLTSAAGMHVVRRPPVVTAKQEEKPAGKPAGEGSTASHTRVSAKPPKYKAHRRNES